MQTLRSTLEHLKHVDYTAQNTRKGITLQTNFELNDLTIAIISKCDELCIRPSLALNSILPFSGCTQQRDI